MESKLRRIRPATVTEFFAMWRRSTAFVPARKIKVRHERIEKPAPNTWSGTNVRDHATRTLRRTRVSRTPVIKRDHAVRDVTADVAVFADGKRELWDVRETTMDSLYSTHSLYVADGTPNNDPEATEQQSADETASEQSQQILDAARKRVDKMQQHSQDTQQAERTGETLAQQAREASNTWEEDGEFLPASFDRIMRLAKIGSNVLMIGPSGSGKTYIAGKVAEKLDRPFGAISCSAGMSESQLAGYLLPIGESGKFAYVPSVFVRMYEEGGVFLFDEVDAADENTILFLNQALANGEFFLPQRFENPRVKRHPDFVAIAAANTFGLGESMLYSGRTQLDGAFLDRFRSGVVMVTYSARVEEKLVDADILEWGRGVRDAIEQHELERVLSTRVMLEFTKQLKAGFSMLEMQQSYFTDWAEDDLNKVAPLYRVVSRVRG